ncbi:MAG: hypothetical protein KC912_23500, partial [Proteobacteria bacterium]|nr:hypothetical protein [Pseudomonadota bacterium]
QRLHPIETLETALPELMALAAAARGEVVVRRCSRVAWGLRSGRVVEQPVALEGLEVEGEPDWLDAAAKVLDDEPPAANPEGIELALAWLDGHPVWLEAWQPH